MNKIINSSKADELIQLAIDDCDNWEDWDTSDRSNFENMGTNLEKVQEHIGSTAVILEKALFMLDICATQITSYSENEFIIDDETGNDISVESVKKFLTDHCHVSGDDDANNQ